MKAESTLYQEETALSEVLAESFGLPAVRIDINKSDVALALAAFRLPGPIDGKAQTDYRSAVIGLVKFRILCEISEKDDSVKTVHICLFICLLLKRARGLQQPFRRSFNGGVLALASAETRLR